MKNLKYLVHFYGCALLGLVLCLFAEKHGAPFLVFSVFWTVAALVNFVKYSNGE